MNEEPSGQLLMDFYYHPLSGKLPMPDEEIMFRFPETVIAAAIRLDSQVWAGLMTHFMLVARAYDLEDFPLPCPAPLETEMRFVTSKARFVDRDEGLALSESRIRSSLGQDMCWSGVKGLHSVDIHNVEGFSTCFKDTFLLVIEEMDVVWI